MISPMDAEQAGQPAERRWFDRWWPITLAATSATVLLGVAIGYAPPAPPTLSALVDAPREALRSVALAGAVFAAWLVFSGGLGMALVAVARPRARSAAAPADLAVVAVVGGVVVSQLALLGWGANGLLAGPTAAFMVGVVLAALWQRGVLGRVLAITLAALILAAPPALVVGLFYGATVAAPPFQAAELNADDKRALVEKVRRVSRTVGGDAPASLRLTERDADVVAHWVLELADATGGAVDVDPRPDGALRVRAAAPIGEGRWVMVGAVVRASVDGEHLRFELDEGRLGRIDLPALVTDGAARWLNAALRSDEDARAVAKAVDRLTIEDGGIKVAYWPKRLPEGLVDRLTGEEDAPRLGRLARRYARALQRRAAEFSSGDTRDVMAALVNAAFTLAAERSARGGDPVLENRVAIYTLAIVIGHRGVQRLYGEAFDSEADLRRTRWRPARIHLHGRHDLARHFWLSAAITLAADARVAALVGQWKEQIDSARGGSGFSFADLLADRAGVRFAEFALANNRNARLIQRRLDQAQSMDMLMPDPAGLPEGLTEARFRAEYGSPESPAYQRLVDKLDQRIDALPLYQREASP